MNNENVLTVPYQDKEIYIVKTAHVSRTSVEDARSCIEEIAPDSICIELDSDRYQSLTSKDRWENTDLVEVIKQKRVGFLLVNTILASFQRRIAKNLETSSGGEMLEGIRQSQSRNIPLVLADRPVKLTFSRIWNSLGLMEKGKLLVTILSSIFEDEEISEEDLAALKESDALEAALADVGKEFPVVKRILVDERDQYLAKKIREAPGKKVVAIVGAAHANGIIRNLNTPVDTGKLEDTSKKKSSLGIVKWLIPLLIIAIVGYTLHVNRSTGLAQIRSWLIWNGGLSAVGTILAAGHPLAVLTSFFLAPLTSLNPLLAVGWFSGIVQARVTKPKVKDFERLGEDTETLKGFRTNKVTRVLLVVVLANVFSTIGTFVSGVDILASFLSIFR